ncbi:MAG: N,N-dimethylformamidase beta subunit family domain-containing protein, partial [Pseudomonadota bacterium]
MIPLIGYADRLSARPGETLEIKVSSQSDAPYQASLVRIRSADPNPEGPGIREAPVEAAFAGSYPSRRQEAKLGSYAVVDETGPLQSLASFTIAATIWPTLPARRQAVISWAGGRLGLDDQGHLTGELGNTLLRYDGPLQERRWVRIWLSFDGETGRLSLGLDNAVVAETTAASGGISGPLLFAAGQGLCDHFNGKIERPRIHDRALADGDEASCVADWDFAQDTSSTRIVDAGPHGLHGRLVNMPARAMTGASWRAQEMCWRHALEHYGAIHFHEDDIHDCAWQTDFTVTVPDDLRSGLYGVRLVCGENADTVPFVVCPPRGQTQAEICLIVPTFTYVIYGNHARRDQTSAWDERAKAWGAYPWNPAKHPEYGLSTYNFHADGSGICHASAKRPLLTLRSGYFHFFERRGSGLRHLQADTHLIHWLEESGFAYDLVTDHELHAEGAALLAPYRVVLTASHPEYHTTETLDAIEGYRDGGGRFCYLGGNGFYWRVALHPEDDSLIEVRRGEGGIRAWAAEPGEYYNAFDGAYGGLWRRSGRPPQTIAGLGFTAQGTFYGSYYERQPASRDPRFAWMFDGIEDERLGDFGLCGGGAAGFELDRVDRRLGTPENAVVLASSRGHDREEGDFFVLVPEEQLTHNLTSTGEPAKDLIRADMIFYETGGGGAVFSVGSITFCG